MTPATRSGFLVLLRFLQLGALLQMCIGGGAIAQPFGFAGDAQHTGIYNAPAQPLNAIHWATSLDINGPPIEGHYGAPVISAGNTLFASVKVPTGFRITAFDAGTGQHKYALSTDYIPPPDLSGGTAGLPVYQAVIANPPSGPRLYYAGAGGTVYYIENIDTNAHSAPVQQCFYTNLTAYAANADGTSGFTNTIFINTPLTADSNGVVFFGFRIKQTLPVLPNVTNDGFARIDPAGNASYVLAGPAAADSSVNRDSNNSAPALSNDGGTLYVPVKGSGDAYLLGLDSVTLATKFRVSVGLGSNVSDGSTASPLVGPDGDVFFGVLPGGPPGRLLHFSADLQTSKTPGAFGYDNTACIVPTNMVPSYTGPSSYQFFTKYNAYAQVGEGGINRVALLDPNATEVKQYSGTVMREVLTAIGPTPDPSYGPPQDSYAVQEWCIDTAAVNPASQSVFAPCEDGHLYCWNLASNSLIQVAPLTNFVSESYVPTLIGPDGTVFTISTGALFAIGGLTNLGLAIYSSAPDMRTLIFGQSVTFTAVATNLGGLGPTPTGTITFEETWSNGYPVTNILAAAVPLTNGIATFTTTGLGTNSLGNHFITAAYSGDGIFSAGSATLVQKVHAQATATTVTAATQTSNTVIITATVASNSLSGVRVISPGGMVIFCDGPTVIGQVGLHVASPYNQAAFTNFNYAADSHSLSATFVSDTVFAASTGAVAPTPPTLTSLSLPPNNAFQLNFSNAIGAPFTVLGSTDITAPFIDWSILGPATEISPGSFQFTDVTGTNGPRRFYSVRSP